MNPEHESQVAEILVPGTSVRFHNPQIKEPEIVVPTKTEITFHSPESLGLLSVDSTIPI
jgi:hypothetical protein